MRKNLFGVDWEDAARKQNNAVEIARIFQSNDNNAFPEQKGTAYSLLNAVTNYADHYRTSRITTDGYSEQQARAKSVLIGSGVTLKEQALESILQAVEMTPTKESLVTPFIKTKSISNIMTMIA